MCNLNSLLKNCNTKMTPGVKIIMEMVYANEILTFPTLKTTTGAGDTVTLDGDIVLKPTASWKQLQISTRTGKIEGDKAGEDGQGGWKTSINGFIAGNGPAEAEFACCIDSPCGVVVIVHQNDGNVRLIGSPDMPAFVKSWKEDTGEKLEDKAGHTFKIEADNQCPAYYYEGVITPII